MLDINLFRNEPETIRKDHDKRGIPHDKIDQVIEFDQTWINLQHETNQLRAQKNTAARGIGAAKKSGDQEAAQRILAEVAELGAQIAEMEKKPMRQLQNATSYACPFQTSSIPMYRKVLTNQATHSTAFMAKNQLLNLNLAPTTNLSK